MTSTDAGGTAAHEGDRKVAREAARDAEREVWRHHRLEVEERFIEVEEPPMRVRVLECGNPSGEPLVFVQGGLGEAMTWAGLMARLTDFRCITLDRPGSGLSDGVDFMEEDVRRLAVRVLSGVLDAAAVDRATFVANSMGGWWTLQLAMATPDRVSRMVLLGCPAAMLDTAAPLPMRLVSLPVVGSLMAKSMSPASPARARELPRFLGHPRDVGDSWPEAVPEAYYRLGRLPDFHRSWRTLLRRFLRLTGPSPEMRITAEELRGVTQPTLFLWGSDDPFGGVETGRRAVELMPDARLEVVGVGHLPWWDEPDECARRVRDFHEAERAP